MQRGEVVVATDHGAVDEHLRKCSHPTTALNARERGVIVHGGHCVRQIQGAKQAERPAAPGTSWQHSNL